MDEKGFIYVDYDINDFEVYMSYEEELVNTYDSFIINFLKNLQENEDMLYILVPICAICIAIILHYERHLVKIENSAKKGSFPKILAMTPLHLA